MNERQEIMHVDKMRRVLRLTNEGKSVDYIADQLNTTTKLVRAMLKEALKVERNEADRDIEEYRQVISGRIEWGLEKLAPKVAEGSPFAFEKWISGNMALAKLHGVEAPASPAELNVNIKHEDVPPGLESAMDKLSRLINRGAARLEALGIKESGDVVEAQALQLDDQTRQLPDPE